MRESSMLSAKILLVSKTRCAADLAGSGAGSRPWQVDAVGSPWEALERVQAGPGPDLVLLDLTSGDSDGLHGLRWLRRVRPDLPVLVLAGCEDPDQRRETICLGAQDFLVLPLRPQQLETAIRRALLDSSADPESEILTEEIEHISDTQFFVAASPTMRKLRAQAELLAQVNAPVLIAGENGSGRELAARLIHKLSVRSGFRFVKINCATLPGDVLASELFSTVHPEGRTQPSKLELCQRGTLFLDEIVEMPMNLQAKLLHALQNGFFVRPGAERLIAMDVRILAASEVNVEQAIAEGRLRQDLYYRLSAFTVHVPALRQRKEEIPLLLGHFMHQLARRYSLPPRTFSAAAVAACQRHSWPGNLRELEKFVKCYLVMGDDKLGLAALERDDREFWNSYLPRMAEPSGANKSGWKIETAETQPGPSGLKSLLQSVKGEAERNAISTALEQARWNRKAAARLLKVSYRTLLYKIEQYHMTPPTGHMSG